MLILRRYHVTPVPALLAVAAVAAVAVILVATHPFSHHTPVPATANETLRVPAGTDPALAATEKAGGKASAITAGDYATCALVKGAAECWGDDHYGQLGNGSTTASSSTPVPVGGLESGVKEISAGGSDACAIRGDGSVVCWGANEHGQVGDGTTVDRTFPTAVGGIARAVQVSVGVAHACAVLRDGSVRCWGAGSNGELGNRHFSDSSTAVQVALSGPARAVSTGLAFACALLRTGRVECWGSNSNGQLGDDTTLDSATPVRVSGLSGVTAIDAGDAHACAVLHTGRVRCWGWNIAGQLGNGGGTDSSLPVAAAHLPSAVAVSAGSTHTCALTRPGAVYCWGANLYGELGNGTMADSSGPVRVTGLNSGVRAIATGLYHSCAILRSGSTSCWGWNARGQLGDAATTSSSSPVSVAGLGPARDGSGVVSASPSAIPSGTRRVAIELRYVAALGGIHDGALAVNVPHSWRRPSTSAGAAGYVSASAGTVVVSGRQISVLNLTLASGRAVTITYGGARLRPPASGSARWAVREQSSPSGTLSRLARQPRISVLAANGSGTLESATSEIANGVKARTIHFLYKAAAGGLADGSLSLAVPAGWSVPSLAPGSAGYTTASRGTVAVQGRTIEISGLTLGSGRELHIAYGSKAGGSPGAQAPSTDVGAQSWAAKQRSAPAGALRSLSSVPDVTVLSPDGAGFITSSTSAVPNGAHHVSLTFVYHTGSGGMKKGLLELSVPRGWSAPSTAPKAPGYTTVSNGKLAIEGRKLRVSLPALAGYDSVTLTYGSTDRGGSGAVAPSGFVGVQTWQTHERSTKAGRLLSIEFPARISVLAPDGSGSLGVASGTVVPGSSGNTVVFIFAAADGGTSGGTVVFTVPAGWSAPSLDPRSPGYVTTSPGAISIVGRQIVVYGLSLFGGSTTTIVYGSRAGGGTGATASAASDGPATWAVREQSSSSGRLLRLRRR